MPLTALTGEFPTTADRFYLAYAESVSAVDYLIRTYGQAAMAKLVKTYGTGASDDEAFTAAFGVDTAAVGQAWLADNGVTASQTFGPQPAPPGPVPARLDGFERRIDRDGSTCRGWDGRTLGGPGAVRRAVDRGQHCERAVARRPHRRRRPGLDGHRIGHLRPTSPAANALSMASTRGLARTPAGWWPGRPRAAAGYPRRVPLALID